MHSVKIRFEDLTYDFIALQAARSGTTFSEFVRGAGLVRAALTCRAENPTDTAELLGLFATATTVLEQLTDSDIVPRNLGEA